MFKRRNHDIVSPKIHRRPSTTKPATSSANQPPTPRGPCCAVSIGLPSSSLGGFRPIDSKAALFHRFSTPNGVRPTREVFIEPALRPAVSISPTPLVGQLPSPHKFFGA